MSEDTKKNAVIEALFKATPMFVVVALSSYMSLQVLTTTQTTKLEYVERDLADIKAILTELTESSVQIARQAEWMRAQERRMQLAENSVDILKEQTRDLYTRTEAQKDLELLRRELQ